MRDKYDGNDRSQKLKYHIQTSGRTLHAQEIAFNDIRTTLQALLALYDNCNSLHTNAYDEAITTPDRGERAARAGDPAHHQQGARPRAATRTPSRAAFIIEELTDLVEEAVMLEFRRSPSAAACSAPWSACTSAPKIQEESLLLRDAEARRHAPDHRRQHLPRSRRLAHHHAARSHPRRPRRRRNTPSPRATRSEAAMRRSRPLALAALRHSALVIGECLRAADGSGARSAASDSSRRRCTRSGVSTAGTCSGTLCPCSLFPPAPPYLYPRMYRTPNISCTVLRFGPGVITFRYWTST